MPSILDDIQVRRAALPITRQQYHLLGEAGLLNEKVELLQGVIVVKMPKSALHVFLVSLLFERIRSLLPSGWCIFQAAPLATGDSEPEPDLAVVPGERADYRRELPSRAGLVVEVALTSQAIDRQKATVYAAAGVPEYWIVLPENRCVEVYRDPRGEVYANVATLAPPSTLRCRSIPEVEVDLGAVFRDL